MHCLLTTSHVTGLLTCCPQESPSPVYSRQAAQSDLRLYLEVPSSEGRPLHSKAPDEFLLFFKLYDPVKERLTYLGQFYARKAHKLPDLVPMLNKMAGFAEGTALEVCSRHHKPAPWML